MKPAVLDIGDTSRWVQEGTFPDADGTPVRAYDDVVLLKPTLPDNDADAQHEVPAGTVGTVLFHSGDQSGVLQLELDWHVNELAFVIGYARPINVRLHQTNEQKYPR